MSDELLKSKMHVNNLLDGQAAFLACEEGGITWIANEATSIVLENAFSAGKVVRLSICEIHDIDDEI